MRASGYSGKLELARDVLYSKVHRRQGHASLSHANGAHSLVSGGCGHPLAHSTRPCVLHTLFQAARGVRARWCMYTVWCAGDSGAAVVE